MKRTPFICGIVGGATVLVLTLFVLRRQHEPCGLKPSAPATNAAAPSPTSRPPCLPAVLPLQASNYIRREVWTVTTVSGVDRADRFKALHAIRADLSQAELDALYRYLRSQSGVDPRDTGFEREFKNELMNQMVGIRPLPRDLSAQLISISQDEKQDPVIRDYAVQHIGGVCQRVRGDEQQQLQTALWIAAGRKGSSTVGTALLALLDLAADKERVAGAALQTVRDPAWGTAARSTALQVCGRLGVTNALPAAIELAQDSPAVVLRISAIAAIGELGGTKELTLLRRWEPDADPLLGRVIKAAEAKIAQRSQSRLAEAFNN